MLVLVCTVNDIMVIDKICVQTHLPGHQWYWLVQMIREQFLSSRMW